MHHNPSRTELFEQDNASSNFQLHGEKLNKFGHFTVKLVKILIDEAKSICKQLTRVVDYNSESPHCKTVKTNNA